MATQFAELTVKETGALTPAQREVLLLSREGKSVKQIARKRKTTTNAVHAAFGKIRAAGFAVGRAQAQSNGSPGKPPEPPAPPEKFVHGVEAVKNEAEAQRDALKKDVENKAAEADTHRAAAGRLDAEITSISEEIEKIESVITVL